VAGLASWGKGGFGRRKGGRLLGTLCWWWPGWSGNLPEIAGGAPPLRSTAAPHERVVAVAGMRHGWNSGWLHGLGKAGARLGGRVRAPATRFGSGAEKEKEVVVARRRLRRVVWSRAPVRCPDPSVRRDCANWMPWLGPQSDTVWALKYSYHSVLYDRRSYRPLGHAG
jgi:hypothetical protein